MTSGMKFETKSHGGRPGIFWQQEGEQKTTRKFGYKAKEQRFSLRKPGADVDITDDALPSTYAPASSSEIKPLPKKLQKTVSGESLAESNVKQRSQKVTDFLKRNRQTTKKRPNGLTATDHEQRPIADTNYVTLTQEQLSTILASVGKITSGKEDAVKISIDLENKQINLTSTNDKESSKQKDEGVDEDEDNAKKQTDDTGDDTGDDEDESTAPVQNIFNLIKNAAPTKDDVDASDGNESNKDTETKNKKDKQAQKRTKKKSVDVEKKDEKGDKNKVDKKSDKASANRKDDRNDKDNLNVKDTEKRKKQLDPEDTKKEKSSPVKETVAKIVTPPPPSIQKTPLTIAERKRLQWEKERAEVETYLAYDPWNRPGGGAPLTKSSPPMMKETQKQQKQPQSSPQQNPIKSQQSPQNMKKSSDMSSTAIVVDGHASSTAVAMASSTWHAGKPPPAAIRSSFVIGEAAPDSDQFLSVQQREKRKWLEELEKQVEANRLAKVEVSEVSRHQDAQVGVWKDRWADNTNKAGQHLNSPVVVSGSQVRVTSSVPVTDLPPVSRINSAPPQPHEYVDELDVAQAQLQTESFIRGQNAFIDPLTRKELEEKKSRYLEHQEAIRAQVDEKNRLKRLAREHKLQEEREEEARLQHERDMLQNQFEQEQRKVRQKEEARLQRVEMLKDAMDNAQQAALQDKHNRRLQHLREGGHDTKLLEANLEVNTARDDAAFFTTSLVNIATLSPRNVGMTPAVGRTLDMISPRHVQVAHLQSSLNQEHDHYQPPPYHGMTNQHAEFYLQKQVLEQQQNIHTAYQHDPYTENRVLTPSVYRSVVLPPTDPKSPKREFATQTAEFDAVTLKGERPVREMSEVDIQYRDNVQQRVAEQRDRHRRHDRGDGQDQVSRIRKKAEKNVIHSKMSLKDRPKWGMAQNAEQRVPAKQSERDPFYAQKKKQSENRKARREQQLLAQVDANKDAIPISKDRNVIKDVDFDDRGRGMLSPHHVKVTNQLSDHIIQGNYDLYQRTDRLRSESRLHNNDPNLVSGNMTIDGERVSRTEHINTDRRHSPPVPHLRHRLQDNVKHSTNDNSDHLDNDYDIDGYNFERLYQRQQAGKTHPDHPPNYEDNDYPIPSQDMDEFIPFMRSTEILDPSKAAASLPISRESSCRTRARHAYIEGHRPGYLGKRMENFGDKNSQLLGQTEETKDPILNPRVVTGHPTPRQDQILQQLSNLKQTLMQKQREIESCLSPSELNNYDNNPC